MYSRAGRESNRIWVVGKTSGHSSSIAGGNVVSSKLSSLQQAFVDAFFNEPSAFLTGGRALAGFHLGHRMTDDRDLFSPQVEPMELSVQRLRRTAAAIDATVEALQETPDFRRFAVRREAEQRSSTS
jgi:hypothetical protein